jgi:F-type H+-transporting ATPase subunit delta
VTVAQPLNEARQAALTEQLRRVLGARVSVDIRVDPALLGGMIVRVGSRMIDASMSSRLQRLRLAMRASG